jgi:hypothetical protein
MPSRLVILAEEVLFQGGAEAPGRAGFDALARLTHAGHPVAVILAGNPTDGATPLELQRLAQQAGGQLVAFFHRPRRGAGLASVLGEVTDRWRVDPAQLHGVFGRLDDLACVAACGATAVALTELLEPQADLPPKTWVHDDLTAFVDALLEEPDEET